ncbi:MAG: histidinol-phosphate transaminase [Candidatus Electryoneaceae bacterium]|nr:histidinol-phosphate transaminase [Candidatus Electryoneaceae bacterium]
MTEISPLARRTVRTIIPYEPGKPISEVKREYGLSDVIKLASNENPLGSSPKALDAIRNALSDVHRYPDGGGYYLKKKLSERFGLPPEMIVLGNGSAELVELVTEAFISPQDEMITGHQAFFKYRIAVQIMDGTMAWADMPNLNQDPKSIIEKITERTRLIFIANPNNPTGTLMNRDQVVWMMERIPENVIVVFDEAYYDYRSSEMYPDTMKYVKSGRNVIILRTFSKSYGLAGLRIGYAMTTTEIARAMNGVREAFNVNSLALVAAEAALDDDEFLQNTLSINAEGKIYFYSECQRLGLEYVPSEANFVLIKVPLPGRELFKKLLERGVVVRPVDGYGLPDYVRVSIGLPAENERFFSELEKVLHQQGLI